MSKRPDDLSTQYLREPKRYKASHDDHHDDHLMTSLRAQSPLEHRGKPHEEINTEMIKHSEEAIMSMGLDSSINTDGRLNNTSHNNTYNSAYNDASVGSVHSESMPVSPCSLPISPQTSRHEDLLEPVSVSPKTVPRFQMGYLESCEKCRHRVQGHYAHWI